MALLLVRLEFVFTALFAGMFLWKLKQFSMFKSDIAQKLHLGDFIDFEHVGVKSYGISEGGETNEHNSRKKNPLYWIM